MRFFLILLFVLISFKSFGESLEDRVFDSIKKNKELSSLYQKIKSNNKNLINKESEYFKEWENDNIVIISDYIYFDDLREKILKSRFRNYLDNFKNISSFELLKRRIYDYGWPFYYTPEGRIQIGIYNRLLVSGSDEKVLDYIKSNFRITIDQERFLLGLTNKRLISIYGNDFDNDGIDDISIKVSDNKRTCSKFILFKVLEDKTIIVNELPKKISDIKCNNNFIEYIELKRKNFLLHYVNNDQYKNPFSYIELYDLKTNKMIGKITITYSSRYSGSFAKQAFNYLSKEVNSIVNSYAIGETTLTEKFSKIRIKIPEDKLKTERNRFEKSYGKNSYINYIDIDNSGVYEQVMFAKDSGKNIFIVLNLEDNSVYDFDERFGSKTNTINFSGREFHFKNSSYFPIEYDQKVYMGKISFAYERNNKLNMFIMGIYLVKDGHIQLIDKALIKPEQFLKDFQF